MASSVFPAPEASYSDCLSINCVRVQVRLLGLSALAVPWYAFANVFFDPLSTFAPGLFGARDPGAPRLRSCHVFPRFPFLMPKGLVASMGVAQCPRHLLRFGSFSELFLQLLDTDRLRRARRKMQQPGGLSSLRHRGAERRKV